MSCSLEEIREISQYIKELRACIPLSREEERECISRAKKGDGNARNKVIKANLRFVFTVAEEYAGKGVRLNDLIEEGNIGLIYALDRFNPSRGTRFITYAVWWIRRCIEFALLRESMVKLPNNRYDDMRMIAAVSHAVEQRFEREPTAGMIAHEMNVTEKRVCNAFASIAPVIRLDDSQKHANGAIRNQLPDESRIPEVRFKKERSGIQDDTLYVERLLSFLTPREGMVLRMYFGINEKQACTLAPIARKFGVSTERVRQIKDRAIAKLHKMFQENDGSFD